MKQQPLYQHDCDVCIYLGRYSSDCLGPLLEFDLYLHPVHQHPLGGSIIARYGNEGPDYESVPAWLDNLQAILGGPHQAHLRQCYNRAVNARLLVGNKVTPLG